MRIFIKRMSLMACFAIVSTMFITVSTMTGAVLMGAASSQAEAAVVSSIVVRGNRRVDSETVRSYLTVKPGVNFTSFDTDESLRQLFATGLFSDVRISRNGRTLIVEVDENPTINLVRFVGNDKVRDDQLSNIVQSKSLEIFSQEKVDSDLARVREVVRRSGRASSTVTVQVDELENNRVDVVFQINEGGRTRIADINFVGNNAYGDRRLTEIISHNESNFLSWLKRDDLFDPDRLRADEERLRRFYFNRGYADFRVISAVGDFNEEKNNYTITITVDEGERYAFGNIEIDNALTNVDPQILQDSLKVRSGDVYSARDVEKTLVAMTEAIASSGFPFAEVTPRGDRDFDNRTINITFFVDEGPRSYIERIEVSGNTRTRGYVIRREFDISEGDAYNRVLVNRAKRRLDALGFFETVRITTRPGSSPDRVIVVVNVKDKPTGDISFGGGFSSAAGAVGEVSLTERNFLGRGQFLKISGSFGEDVTKYDISFTEPYFLGNRIAVGFDASRQEITSNNGTLFDSDVTTFRLRAQAPLTDNFSASVNYTYRREDTSVDPNLSDGNPANGELSPATLDTVNRSPFTTSSIGYGLVYSTIDNFKNPREGIHATFNQDFAGLAGDAQYVKTTGRITAYYLAAEDADIVLLGAVGAGHIEGFGSDTLRVTDHFLQGGETIRGFDVRGFGPRDSLTNEPLGGTTFVNATAEVQFPLPLLARSSGLRGALFAEGGTLYGNDFSSPTVIDSSDIRASVGASIIWDSPFGPLRADFSQTLLEESFDRTQFFRFGVSTKF